MTVPGSKKGASYAKTARRGAKWSAIRQGGHELIAIPMSMIMARLLTPNDFGVTVASTFFIQLASRLSQFGFNAALVRLKDLRPEHTSSVFVVSAVLAVTNYVVLFAAAPWIGAAFGSESAGQLVRVSALAFLASPFGSVASALLVRGMHFQYQTLSDWTDTLVGALVTITLAFRGWGYWSIPAGNLAATALRVCLQMYLAGWVPSLAFSRSAMREVLSYGLGIQTKRVFEYATQNLDNVIVGRYADLTALGFYDKAFSTMNRVVNRLTLGQAPFRIFAVIHEDRDRFRRAYTRLILSVTMIAFPLLMSCIVVARPLFDVLYGSQWATSVMPFQVLCLGGMFKIVNNYGSQANEAAGAVWHQARRQAIGSVLVLVGAALGTYLMGILGAAIGVTFAMLLLTVAMQDLVRRSTDLTWGQLVAPLGPGLICGAVACVVLWATGAALDAQWPTVASWHRLGVQGVFGLISYAGVVLLLPHPLWREIVHETAADVLPARLARVVHRLGGHA